MEAGPEGSGFCAVKSIDIVTEKCLPPVYAIHCPNELNKGNRHCFIKYENFSKNILWINFS
jgi:hypothetical protein